MAYNAHAKEQVKRKAEEKIVNSLERKRGDAYTAAGADSNL